MGHVGPGLCHILIAAGDAAHAAAAGDSAIYSVANQVGSPAIGGTVVVAVATADDTSYVVATTDRAVEGGIPDGTLAHGVVHGANQAADIVFSLYGGVTGAVLNGAVDLVGKGADSAFRTGVTDNHAILCRTVADGYGKVGCSTGVLITTKHALYQAGFQGLGAIL